MALKYPGRGVFSNCFQTTGPPRREDALRIRAGSLSALPQSPRPDTIHCRMDPDIRWIQRRKSFSWGLIDNGDVWMEMITSRNQTARTYNEEAVGKIAEKVRESYLDAFNALEHDTGEFIDAR